MKTAPDLWTKLAPRLQQRLDHWGKKSFDELKVQPESTADGEDEINGHKICYYIMCWHRDPETVLVVARASQNLGVRGGLDYELGFVMSSRGEMRQASEEEIRSAW